MKKISVFITLLTVGCFLFAGCDFSQAQLFGRKGNATGDGLIGESKARELALEQVPGATESDIREFDIDRSAGRVEYEYEIHYDGMEYSFEIDGYSGEIRSQEKEPIYD